jgi:hypothetical protein
MMGIAALRMARLGGRRPYLLAKNKQSMARIEWLLLVSWLPE